VRSDDTEEVFTVEERTRAFERVLNAAKADPRVTAGAVVGSLAAGSGDRWSDLDLTFAVASENDVMVVLDALAAILTVEFGAVQLFDLPYDRVIYRVLLLRGALQVDISVAPAVKFGARGPHFRLLFGEGTEQEFAKVPVPSAGYAVHHAVRARICIERQRFWQAEFWVSELRDLALSMACARLGLVGAYGRGFDQLPANVLAQAEQGLVRSLDEVSLTQALAGAIALLVSETAQVTPLGEALEERLRLLTRSWTTADGNPTPARNPANPF
jgi:hypothetical protein